MVLGHRVVYVVNQRAVEDQENDLILCGLYFSRVEVCDRVQSKIDARLVNFVSITY